jgi:hypothetical protein
MGTGIDDNRYFGHFKAVLGKGEGTYYANMGHVYKKRPGIQRGYGHYMMGHKLTSRQRGLGFGSTLMSMFRMAAPILKVLGAKAVDVVSNVAKDAIQGQNVKDSVIKHAKNQANDIISKAPAAFTGLVSRASESLNNTISPSVSGIETTSPEISRGFVSVNRKRKAKKSSASSSTFYKRRRGGQYSEGLALLN